MNAPRDRSAIPQKNTLELQLPSSSWESRPNLGALLLVFVISLTVLTVVALGILAAYGLVTGILYAFAFQSRQRARMAPVLVPSESHASGD